MEQVVYTFAAKITQIYLQLGFPHIFKNILHTFSILIKKNLKKYRYA